MPNPDPMDDDVSLSRRDLLRGSTAALGIATIGSIPAAGAEADDESDALESAERIPSLDVTALSTQLEPVDPMAVQPEQTTGIGPGSMLFVTRDDSSGVAGCTANFVWEDSNGDLYLGAAGHCFLPEDAEANENAGGDYDTSGVTTEACVDCTFGGALALNGINGETVELGDVVYARQLDEPGGVGVGNDFGLVEIPDGVGNLVSPSMPTWNGPTKRGGPDAGERVCTYGNGVVFGEVFASKGRVGLGLVHDPDGGSWIAGIPASPGDSGAALQATETTSTGLEGVEAAGVLTHLTNVGVAGTTRRKAKQMVENDTDDNLVIDVVTVD